MNAPYLFESKILVLGMADSRRIFMESPEELARRIGPFIDKVTGDIILEPSYGLEFIPRRYAVNLRLVA